MVFHLILSGSAKNFMIENQPGRGGEESQYSLLLHQQNKAATATGFYYSDYLQGFAGLADTLMRNTQNYSLLAHCDQMREKALVEGVDSGRATDIGISMTFFYHFHLARFQERPFPQIDEAAFQRIEHEDFIDRGLVKYIGPSKRMRFVDAPLLEIAQWIMLQERLLPSTPPRTAFLDAVLTIDRLFKTQE